MKQKQTLSPGTVTLSFKERGGERSLERTGLMTGQ
jgi:hypothetical protein